MHGSCWNGSIGYTTAGNSLKWLRPTLLTALIIRLCMLTGLTEPGLAALWEARTAMPPALQVWDHHAKKTTRVPTLG
jgi:hypothetical protein